MVTVEFSTLDYSRTEHSWRSWGLAVGNYKIGSPDVKTNTVDIAGMDGYLDFTETAIGRACYGNREISIVLTSNYTPANFERICSTVRAFLHGRKRNIRFGFNPDFFFCGRCSVEAEHSGMVGTITVTVDAEPFQRKLVLERGITLVGYTDFLVVLESQKQYQLVADVEGSASVLVFVANARAGLKVYPMSKCSVATEVFTGCEQTTISVSCIDGDSETVELSLRLLEVLL